MVSINTNLSSIIVQRNMAKSTNALNLAIERMTTGAKLNHAKDNAAGYSISKDMDSKISSYAVAQDNIAMGLDMIATAQDNISLMQGHGQRIMDLWTQAQNGTYGTDSLEAIQSEVEARMSEINRLYTNAEYNDISLFENYAIELPDWAETLTNNSVSPTNNGFISNPVSKSQEYVDALTSVEGLTNLNGASEFKIDSAEALANLATLVNDGVSTSGKTFYLASDIDLTSFCKTHTDGHFKGWTPIGYYLYDYTEDEMLNTFFCGTFDGNGHSISGLTLSMDEYDTDDYYYESIGLFGQANIGSIIRNVSLKNVKVSAEQADIVGGLVGYSEGSVSNSYSTGNVSGNNQVGGLVGNSSSGSVSNSYSTGSVSGNDRVGGLVGYSSVGCIVSNSYSTGNVSGNDYVGGLVGNSSSGSVSNSYSTGNVSGNNQVGGLVGASSSTVSNSYSTGTVSGNNQVGGLVGASERSTVSNSYSTGNVSGNKYVGGLVGASERSTVSNSYSTGSVSGNTQVGGLVGRSYGSDISNSYSTGNVKGKEWVGGLIGQIEKTSGSLTFDKIASFGKITGADKVGSLVGGAVTTENGSYWGSLTFTNAQARNQGLNAVGGEYKYTYSTNTYTSVTHGINTWNSAISLIDLPFAETQFQVGINGDSSSQIFVDTNLAISLDVTDIKSAGAYNSIKTFLDSLSEKATQLGAASNRLESALESTTTQINNLTSSLSTIKDADIAHVSSQYIRNQILQQAGATLLATANQSPSIALQLL